MKIIIEHLSSDLNKHSYLVIIDGPHKKFKHTFHISARDWGNANNGTQRLLEFIEEILKQFNETASSPVVDEDALDLSL